MLQLKKTVTHQEANQQICIIPGWALGSYQLVSTHPLPLTYPL